MEKNLISSIWTKAFNAKYSNYQIDRFLFDDAYSCVFQLTDGRELRITSNRCTYNFSKQIKNRSYKHVASVLDCFQDAFPNIDNEEDWLYCIVSEGINRDFLTFDQKQSAINLFRKVWCDYFESINKKIDPNPDISIELAYINNDVQGRRTVVKQLKQSKEDSVVVDIALAIHDAYQRTKTIEKYSHIFLFPENIGMSFDKQVKICYINNQLIGLDADYSIDCIGRSIQITYIPLSDRSSRIQKLEIPLLVHTKDGDTLPVFGIIDTGAEYSGFTEDLIKRGNLENLGMCTISGPTGIGESIQTECYVEFPNKIIKKIHGCSIKRKDNISIIIGMNLLSKCKIQTEPFHNGYRYKLTLY